MPRKSRARGGCKHSLRLHIVLDVWGNTSSVYVTAFYHPRGCMGARENHLDIPRDRALRPLEELLLPRGVSLRCRQQGDAVQLECNEVGLSLLIEAEGWHLRCGRYRAYAMLTKSGNVYVAPIQATKTERKESRVKHNTRSEKDAEKPG